MATGWPMKTTYANGDVYSAGDVNDITGTINLLGSSVATTAGKNGMINGALQVWQRGTSVAVAASTLAYTADRFIVSTPAACASTISRQPTSDTTNLPTIQYCARVQRNSGQTGTGFLDFTQMFETANSIRYAGQTVTLSFYARRGANYSATSNLLKVRVFTGTGTDQSVYAGYTGSAQPVDSSATLTTTWQRFTFTFAVAATATEISCAFTNVTTGTAGAADFFEITGIQLETGSTATAFQTATGTLQGELAACQRYYFRNTATSVNSFFGYGISTSTTAVAFALNSQVTMRVAPTSVDYSTIEIHLPGVADYAFTTLTLDTTFCSTNTAYFNVTGASGLTTSRTYELRANNSSSAYVGFSAEL